MWARLALLPRRERGLAIQRAIDRFELAPVCGRRVDRLSMGQRQRLRLALAFLHAPEVVLLDEPGTSLDEDGLALLDAALYDLKERGDAALVCLPSGWGRMRAIDDAHALADGRLERA
jgi:ABC-type multidrug transport system ATPase subunit